MRTVALATLLFVFSSTIFAQGPVLSGTRVVRPTVTPVVTLGSMALTPATRDCRAVGFSADQPYVVVYQINNWENWHLNSGTRADTVAYNLPQFNDQLHPIGDGKHVLHITRTENKKQWPVVNIATGKEVGKLQVESTSGGYSVSEDGRYVVACGSENSRFYSVLTDMRSVPIERISDVRRCSASHDGKVFGVLADDRVTVFANAQPWRLDLPKDSVYSTLAISPDGSIVATATGIETDNGKRAGPITLWDVRNRKMLKILEKVEWFSEVPHRMRFTPDGKTLLAGDGAFLRGWSVATGAKVFAVEPGWGWVGNIQISPDGKHVAVAYPNRPMVWNLETGKQPESLLGHSGTVWGIAVSPDGTRAATAMYGRPTVYLWDTRTGKNLGEVNAAFAVPPDGGRTVPGRVTVEYSTDGTQLLTNNEASGANGPIRVWDANTMGALREMPVTGRHGASASLTPHGVFAIIDRKPMLIDVATGKIVWEKPAKSQYGTVLLSPRRDRVVVESGGIWNVADGQQIDSSPGVPLVFTQSGSQLIFSRGGDTVFRDTTAKADLRVTKSVPKLQDGAVSRTGLVARQNLELAYRTYEIRRGDLGVLVSTCEETKPTRDLGFGVVVDQMQPSICVFSDDGRSFAVFHHTLRIYETYSGQELLAAPQRSTVRASVFSPDGRTLWTSHGTNQEEGAFGSTQVEGWDLTGGAWGQQPVAQVHELEALKQAMNGHAPSARKALYQLATRPHEAIAFAKEVTSPPTKSDYSQYDLWMKELDSPAFAIRDLATKSLAKAGWRVEAMLQPLLATTESVEVRQRLEKLLSKRDMRPLRAIQLLEVIGSREAIEVLKEVSAGSSDSLVVQDAKWALQRLVK